jgi:hypothetical protein
MRALLGAGRGGGTLMPRPPIPVPAGTRFGRLIVIEDRQGKASHVLCRCDCGTVKEVRVHQLTQKSNPSTRSCGCLADEVRASLRPKVRHGHAQRSGKSPTYLSWKDMVRRPAAPVCARWRAEGGRGFRNFLADVGERPEGTILTRLNPERGYAPGNVRWAARDQSGERNGAARLTVDEVREMRRLLAAGASRRSVAERWGIGLTQVGRIARGETWRDPE